MKRLIILLCTWYLVLAYGTALAASPKKAPPTTLDDIQPAWSRTLQCDTTACPRFELVMGGEAVLDHETGLVWEQSPSSSIFLWDQASTYCGELEVGGRKGWHLPTIEQLASLLDTSVAGSPKMPAGHPFTNVVSSVYWSATTYTRYTDFAWVVHFSSGAVSYADKWTTPNILYVWCVRGGQSYDGR
jgi:hypothetical protein